ncbi:hypothetical protein [Streptomyces beigongshangae]|uniref:hypothetical protein n=1 Tax=Streptomyces beigongshangae TaxID=2841597 RepID=UPI001C84DD91|nr:hypothetical protein [Streptomyces sp. REN17]
MIGAEYFNPQTTGAVELEDGAARGPGGHVRAAVADRADPAVAVGAGDEGPLLVRSPVVHPPGQPPPGRRRTGPDDGFRATYVSDGLGWYADAFGAKAVDSASPRPAVVTVAKVFRTAFCSNHGSSSNVCTG